MKGKNEKNDKIIEFEICGITLNPTRPGIVNSKVIV